MRFKRKWFNSSQEIYTTIISILKKQQKEITELREKLNKNK